MLLAEISIDSSVMIHTGANLVKLRVLKLMIWNIRDLKDPAKNAQTGQNVDRKRRLARSIQILKIRKNRSVLREMNAIQKVSSKFLKITLSRGQLNADLSKELILQVLQKLALINMMINKPRIQSGAQRKRDVHL